MEHHNLSGPITNPKTVRSELTLVPEGYWGCSVNAFGGGPKLEIFINNFIPDFNPIEIYVYGDDPLEASNRYLISPKITVQALKHYICSQQDLSSDKTRLRVIEIQAGTIAFRSVNETLTLIEAGITSGCKVSLTKVIKRVVRFVESDEEADKIIEISTKHSNGMKNLDSAFDFLSF
jgi:hypothetical protein